MQNTVPNTEQLSPALLRGLHLLDELAASGPARLEDLARRASVPKSSCLRLLQTLGAHGSVRRQADGRWCGVRRLTALIDGDLVRRIDEALGTLAAASGHTAEWWMPAQRGMVLERRVAPAEGEVAVRARIGFLRGWRDECEAVMLLGHAFFDAAGPPVDVWAYREHGVRADLTPAEVEVRLRGARADGEVVDEICNGNGVRRWAGVVDDGERPIGVLALAQFVPAGGGPTATELVTICTRHRRELAAAIGTAVGVVPPVIAKNP